MRKRQKQQNNINKRTNPKILESKCAGAKKDSVKTLVGQLQHY